jgi:hypothetical protein
MAYPILKITIISMVLMGFAPQTRNDLTQRVSHPVTVKHPGEFDPAAIHFADEYGVLENLLSPLVAKLPNGELAPGLAEGLIWKGDELHYFPMC